MTGHALFGARKGRRRKTIARPTFQLHGYFVTALRDMDAMLDGFPDELV